MYYRFFVLFLAFAAVGAPPAAAQQPASDRVFVLPDLTVIATRFAVSELDAPSRIALLDSSAFSNPLYANVADVLARNTNLFVRQYGPGGLSTLSARGTTASQSLVLLDGLPLSNPQLGQFDLSVLPRVAFKSASVQSGAASAQFGSAAVGSVVSLQSGIASSARFSTEVQSGSFGERAAAAAFKFGRRRISGSVSASTFTSNGDFRYLDESAFPVRLEKRENADIRRASILATTALTQRNGHTVLTAIVARSQRGLPTVATVPTVGERQEDQLHRVGVSHRVTRGTTLFSVKGAVDQSILRYSNPSVGVDDTGATRTIQGEAEYQRALYGAVTASGVAASYQAASHPSIDTGRSARNVAGFTSGSLPLGRLALYPSGRLDVHRLGDRTFVVPSPRIGMNVALIADGSLRLKSTAGRSFRVPTFNDWYWQGVGARGNAELKPESGWSTDFGVQYVGDVPALLVNVEASVFGSAIRDAIVWIPGDDSVWHPENIGQVRSRGLEFSAKVSRLTVRSIGFSGVTSYSFTDAREISSKGSTGVRNVPRHKLVTTVEARLGRLGLQSDLTAVSKRLVATDGTQSVPPYVVADVTLGYDTAFIGHRVTGFLTVQNALDANYSIIKGYPMPPRGVRMTLRFTY